MMLIDMLMMMIMMIRTCHNNWQPESDGLPHIALSIGATRLFMIRIMMITLMISSKLLLFLNISFSFVFSLTTLPPGQFSNGSEASFHGQRVPQLWKLQVLEKVKDIHNFCIFWKSQRYSQAPQLWKKSNVSRSKLSPGRGKSFPRFFKLVAACAPVLVTTSTK